MLLPHQDGLNGATARREAPQRKNTTLVRDSALDSDGTHHPRHCLGVAAIALDTSTLLAGRSTPEGILYTGGRDGLVAGWELGMPMTKRRRGRWHETLKPGERVRWERLELGGAGGVSAGDWEGDNDYGDADEVDSELEYQEDESYDGTSSDGGMEGDHSLLFEDGETAQTSGHKFPGGRGGISHRRKELEYTERWQIDKDVLDRRQVSYRSPWGNPSAGPQLNSPIVTIIFLIQPAPTTFRQSVQTHTDWVNDILLCNQNQTVISCSSDRTIRAWAPHDTEKSASPELVGQHRDYAKVISYS